MSDMEIKRAEAEVLKSNQQLKEAIDHLAESAVGITRLVRDPTHTVKQAAQALVQRGVERPLIPGAVVFAGAALLGAYLAKGWFRQPLSSAARGEFIDKCTARWLFEKTAVMLYSEVILKSPPELRSRLASIRHEVKQHVEILEDVIQRYGANPHRLTERARVPQTLSAGIVEVVQNEEFREAVEALLAAELIDHAGWDLLGKLAEQASDNEAARLFDLALRRKGKHVNLIRKMVLDNTLAMAAAKPLDAVADAH